MNYKLVQLQLAFFLSVIERVNRLRLADAFLASMPEFATVDPVVLPTPEGFPDIPSIIIGDESVGWRIQYSPSRCDLFRSMSPATTSIEEPFGEFRQRVSTLWGTLYGEYSARAERLGVVATFTHEAEDAVTAFQSRYLKYDRKKQPRELQLHYLEEYALDRFDMNCWVRLLAGSTPTVETSRVTLIIDVNTRQEQPLLNADVEVVDQFFNAATEVILRILNEHS